MTTIRLFILSLFCCSVLSTLTAQGEMEFILPYPVGTTESEVVANITEAGGTGTLKDSAPMFGLFLVTFRGIYTDIPCEKLPEALQSACPKCPPPKGSSSTGIQGGPNYRTYQPFIKDTSGVMPGVIKPYQIDPNTTKQGSMSCCQVTTAFLDSGMDKTHIEQFNPDSWFSNTTATTLQNFSTPYDENGHGTHVIGITANIIQNYQNIRLLSIKTQDKEGNGTVWRAIKGIELAIFKRAKIINMSLAYTPNECTKVRKEKDIRFNAMPISKYQESEQYSPLEGLMQSEPLFTAMSIAGKDYGVGFITAAGNDRENLDNENLLVFPSMFNLPNQINVAALDSYNNLVDNGTWGSNHGYNYVNIGALGDGVSSSALNGDIGFASGTSSAAPFVTAVASVILANSCGTSFDYIKKCILETATPRDLSLSTYGFLNSEEAIRCRYEVRDDYAQEAELFKKSKIETSTNTFKTNPNPFDEAFNLKFSTKNDNETTKCTLYNFSGQIIKEIDYQGSIDAVWNVKDLPTGAYLLKVQQGATQEIRKLIKQ